MRNGNKLSKLYPSILTRTHHKKKEKKRMKTANQSVWSVCYMFSACLKYVPFLSTLIIYRVFRPLSTSSASCYLLQLTPFSQADSSHHGYGCVPYRIQPAHEGRTSATWAHNSAENTHLLH